MTKERVIHASKMKAKASEINSEINKMKSLYLSIKTSCENLSKNWEGDSSEFYINKIKAETDINKPSGNANNANAYSLIEYLNKCVKDINEIAVSAEKNETRAASNISAIKSNVFNI